MRLIEGPKDAFQGLCYLPALYCGVISIYEMSIQLNYHFNMCSQEFLLGLDRTRNQMLP